MRGGVRRIFRLASFDRWGLVHALAFRALVLAALAAAALIILHYAGIVAGTVAMDVAIVLVWALFAPQIFYAVRAFCIIGTSGRASPYLNRSFVESSGSKGGARGALLACYAAVPYLVLGLWLAALMAYVVVVL